MSERQEIWDLKESAKWAGDEQKRREAVNELATYGESALPTLEEIMSVTAYDEIKTACIDAINSIKNKESGTTAVKKTSIETKAKEEEVAATQKEEEVVTTLADLPP